MVNSAEQRDNELSSQKQLRFDEEHSIPAPFYVTPEVNVMRLREAIGTMAFDFRRDVASAISTTGSTEVPDILNRVPLRSNANLATEIAFKALEFEKSIHTDDPIRKKVRTVLEAISQADYDRALLVSEPISSDDLADLIVRRGSFRRNDIHLTEADMFALEQRIGADQDLRTKFEQLTREREALLLELQCDPKYPCILNAKAFEASVSACESQEGVFAFCDVANFKKMNDEFFGYQFVDSVILEKICSVLSEEFMDTGSISRFGGDEFMVFVRETKDEFSVAKRISWAFCRAIHQMDSGLIQENKYLIPEGKAMYGKSVDEVREVLETLHLKIGSVQAPQGARQDYEAMRTESVQNLDLAAEKKAEMDFPWKSSTHSAQSGLIA